MKYDRIILLVLDGCGIGSQEDYRDFQTETTNTLGDIYRNEPNFHLPFLESLGLSDLIETNSKSDGYGSYFGKMRETTAGNDTFAGVWEMFGNIFTQRFSSNQGEIDAALIGQLKKELGLSVVGNEYISGYLALDKYYDEHVKTGAPILYLSDDGVILVAAHEDIIDAITLNELGAKMAKILFNQGFTRIITRPFYGTPNNFIRDEAARKDFLLINIPKENLVKTLLDRDVRIRMTPHLARIFDHPPGLSMVEKKYNNNQELFHLIEEDLGHAYDLQAYVVPDTDNLGHKKNTSGFARALVGIDGWLSEFSKKLGENDLLIITADHGCDPASNMRGHSREFVPLFLLSKRMSESRNLGTRQSFADIGQTIAYNFDLPRIKTGNIIHEIF